MDDNSLILKALLNYLQTFSLLQFNNVANIIIFDYLDLFTNLFGNPSDAFNKISDCGFNLSTSYPLAYQRLTLTTILSIIIILEIIIINFVFKNK
jgi:hypothetical protein